MTEALALVFAIESGEAVSYFIGRVSAPASETCHTSMQPLADRLEQFCPASIHWPTADRRRRRPYNGIASWLDAIADGVSFNITSTPFSVGVLAAL